MNYLKHFFIITLVFRNCTGWTIVTCWIPMSWKLTKYCFFPEFTFISEMAKVLSNKSVQVVTSSFGNYENTTHSSDNMLHRYSSAVLVCSQKTTEHLLKMVCSKHTTVHVIVLCCFYLKKLCFVRFICSCYVDSIKVTMVSLSVF